MTEIPASEPRQFTAGDYVQWKRPASNCITPAGETCKASDGWALTYALVKTDKKIEISATASGDDHLVTLAATVTANYQPGSYSWQAYVTKGSERYTIDWGHIEILRNFAGIDAQAGYDDRSHVKKVLDALEAKLEGRATQQQNEIPLGGESIGLMPIQRVLEWRDKYKAAYEQEQLAQDVAKDLGHNKNIYVRFKDA